MPMDDDGAIYLPTNFRSLNCDVREVPHLDRPNQDPTLRRWRLLEGAPAPHDSRLYLDRKALRFLLDRAEASPTGRVVIHGAVFDVELREARNGHRYNVIRFEGSAEPEGLFGSDQRITRAGG
jgi:hypothetical protein